KDQLRSAVLAGGHGRRVGAERTASQSCTAAIARGTIDHQPLAAGRIDRRGEPANTGAISAAGFGANSGASKTGLAKGGRSSGHSSAPDVGIGDKYLDRVGRFLFGLGMAPPVS